MLWLLLGLIVVLGGFVYSLRRGLDRVESILSDLAHGRTPPTLIIHGPRFLREWSSLLEEIADRQRLLSQQISEEEFSLQAILSGMAEGVAVVDRAHVIRLVNTRLESLFELSESPLRLSVLQAFRNADIEMAVRNALQKKQPQSDEIEFKKNGDSAVRYLEMHAVPISGTQEKQIGVVMVFHDVTRIRQLENVRREFVANVSHEFRTPLSIFRGYLETLLLMPMLPEKDRERHLKTMQRHSERMNHLVEDLLMLARLESDRLQLEFDRVSIPELIQELVDDWNLKLAEKKIGVQLEVPPDLPPVWGDRLRLEQVFSNLLENAVKYSRPDTTIMFSARQQDNFVAVRIRDHGVGIPPQDLAHIFERFYRVDKSRARSDGGTGLGLSIVKHIIQRHGGSVSAESTFNEGTAIEVRLPCGDGENN